MMRFLRCGKRLILACIWLTIFLGVFALEGAAAPCVAIVVTGARDAADWQAVLAVRLLAARPATELVERGELARVWAERERIALTAKPEAGLAVATVERYLHFRRVGDERWIVELVDASSGRALGSAAVEAAEVGAAARLVAAAVGLLDAPVPVAKSRMAKVAVVESADVAGDEGVFGLAVRLRAALADSGLTVLDRALTQELAVERNDAKKGFRADATSGSLLGLDFWIELATGEVRLVRVRDGVVVSTAPYVVDEDRAEKLRDWALPHLGVTIAKAGPYLSQVEIEALEPFFKGLALHDAGRFAEASGKFTKAYRINGRFREAYEWAARCYDALEIPEMAAAMRRYLGTEFLENLPAASGRVVPVDGLTFLGVRATENALVPVGGEVSAISASVLTAREGLGVRLPDQLARLRREYDWMTADGAESGYGAENAPGFFTRYVLSGELARNPDGVTIQWTLRDSLGLRPPVRRTQSLAANPEKWRAQLAAWLAGWPTFDLAAFDSARQEHDDVKSGLTAEEIVARLRAAHGVEAETLRLSLMRVDPANPLSVIRAPGKADEPLSSFLDYGRREYVINRLPPDNSQRRWLELMRALDHFNEFSPAKAFAGRRLDTAAELKRLIAACATDGAGLAARYYQLFWEQGHLPPPDLAIACHRLRDELKAKPDRIVEIYDKLAAHVDALERLAATAAGTEIPGKNTDAKFWLNFFTPTDAPDLGWDANGRLICDIHNYVITRRHFAGLDEVDRVRNAQAQLAINGRGNAQTTYDLAWLAAYPRTPALAFYVTLSLSHSGYKEGFRVGKLRSWAEEKEHLHAGLAYVKDTVEDGFSRLTNPDALNNMSTLATAVVGVAGNPRISELMPEEERVALQMRLAAAEAAARARVVFRTGYNPNIYNLAELTPGLINKVHADSLDHFRFWISRADILTRELVSRGQQFAAATKPGEPHGWWWLSRRWETDAALTAPERANILAPHAEEALRVETAAFDEGAGVRLFDLGLMLLYGRCDEQAERIFSYLSERPVTMESPLARRELVANACFRLSQLYRMAGRNPEALATASRGLALATREDTVFYEGSVGYIYNKGGLAAQFARLLAELRFDPAKIGLPDRVDCVRVPTVNGDNPLLTVYYRRPPLQAKAKPGGSRHRVLLIIPVTNQDAFDYVNPESSWARFADDHDLVLVVPRFCVSDRIFRIDHRFTHAHFPEAWSGEAMIRALDDINRRVPIDSGRLLVHGQTSGAGFATHFAAWRPDLVAAVSVVNGNWGLSRLATAALKPLSDERDIRFWVAANPTDNTAQPTTRPRFACAQEFAARLRDAGAHVEWSEWPNVSHTPSTEMEDAARAFLARQLLP